MMLVYDHPLPPVWGTAHPNAKHDHGRRGHPVSARACDCLTPLVHEYGRCLKCGRIVLAISVNEPRGGEPVDLAPYVGGPPVEAKR